MLQRVGSEALRLFNSLLQSPDPGQREPKPNLRASKALQIMVTKEAVAPLALAGWTGGLLDSLGTMPARTRVKPQL
ncbi:MAG: hypothetical protein QM750_29215 [Rubrivivax sp.]